MEVNRVILKWDSSYAKSFKIQLSTDNAAWNDVYGTTTAGARSVTDETFPAATARYVRMHGTEQGNPSKGYALFDFMVLNDTGVTTVTTSNNLSKKVAVVPELFLTCMNNTIRYVVPSGCRVALDVVDYRGTLVAVLADGFRHAGCHTAAVPGGLSSGMYLVRLTEGSTWFSVPYIKW